MNETPICFCSPRRLKMGYFTNKTLITKHLISQTITRDLKRKTNLSSSNTLVTKWWRTQTQMWTKEEKKNILLTIHSDQRISNRNLNISFWMTSTYQLLKRKGKIFIIWNINIFQKGRSRSLKKGKLNSHLRLKSNNLEIIWKTHLREKIQYRILRKIKLNQSWKVLWRRLVRSKQW